MLYDRSISRRNVLKSLAAGGAAAALGVLAQPGPAWAAAGKLRLGACMVNLEEAKQAGLDGAEIRAGIVADRLEVADPTMRAKYKDQMRATGLPISSVVMGILNSCPLASDPRGPAWLEQTIEGAADLGAKVILVAFFSKGSLLGPDNQPKKADIDVVINRLKAAAPRAAKAGVALAIENTLSAKQNLEILQRIGHDSMRIYYDVGNTFKQGYDVPAEIRLLKDRIAMFHFKDNPHYLGEGKVPFPAIAEAVHDIGYQGWIVLETTSPSKNKVTDARRNGLFVRKLMKMG